MSAPGVLLAGIGHACNCLAVKPCVVPHVPEEFLPHRGEENQVEALAQVLLGNLELRHSDGLFHTAEERAERLAALEIYRTVLDLDNDIVAELPVKMLELLHGLVRTVRAGGGVYESPPHNHSAVGTQRVGQHIGAVNVGAPEVLRTGLPLGRRLHQEASKVRYDGVNLVCLVLPPLGHCRIQGICGRELSQRQSTEPLIPKDLLRRP